MYPTYFLITKELPAQMPKWEIVPNKLTHFLFCKMKCSYKSQFWRWQWSGTIQCWRVSQAAETLPLGWLMSGIIGVSISISISSISASASASTTLFISRHLCPHYQRRERRRRNTTTTSSTLGILRLNMNHSHFLGAEMSLSLPWIESIIFIFLIFCFWSKFCTHTDCS